MDSKRLFEYIVAVVVAISLVLLTAGLGQAGSAKPLEVPDGSEDQGHNAEGIKHYMKKHWDVAEEHFREAVKADKKLAEAHYNLALSLDKLGRHGEASAQFDKALKLAPDNPDIAESGILKAHLGM